MSPFKQLECSICLTMALSHRVKGNCQALPLSKTPLLQVINGVMFLLLCLWVVPSSSILQIFRDATCDGCSESHLPAQSVVPLTQTCPGQYIHRSLQRWMLNRHTCACGLLIHFSLLIALAHPHACCRNDSWWESTIKKKKERLTELTTDRMWIWWTLSAHITIGGGKEGTWFFYTQSARTLTSGQRLGRSNTQLKQTQKKTIAASA